MISALATAAAAVIGSIISAGANMYVNNKNNEFNENQSNPSTLMSKMMAAGINPNAAAQGISGATPYSSASSFNGVPDLGSTLLNALNSEADIENTKADTEVKKEEKRGLGIDNDFSLATFDDRAQALKNQNKLSEYQIEQLRPYAEHADEWYKINFDNLDEKANQIRADIRKIDEEIEKIKKEEELTVAQTGETKSRERLNDSVTALNRQKQQIIDSLGGEDVETAYVRAIADGDNEKAESIKSGIKSYNKSVQEGNVEGSTKGTPQGRLKLAYETEMNEEIAKYDKLIKDAKDVGNGRLVLKYKRQQNAIRRSYRNKIRRVDKGASGGVTVAGTGGNLGG